MESEIIEITVPIPENRLTKQTIKFAEFKKDVDGNSLETVKLKNLLENQDQKRFDNEIIHFIDTTEVTKFSKPGYESFTFKVKTKFNGGFDNLVIVKTKHSVKELIIKYTPSQGWTSSSSSPYTGEVEYLSKKKLTKNPGCVLFIEAVYSRCSAGNNHPPDDSGGVCTVGYGSLIGYNIYEGSGCSGGGGSTGGDGGFGGPGGPSGGPSGSGGGLGGPNPNDPDPNNDTIDGDDIITVPMMRLNTIGMLQDLLNLGSSTTPEMQWLLNQSSNEQMVDIFNFIEAEEESPEAKAFAEEAINAFMENGDVDLEEQIAVFLEGQAKLVYKKLKSTNGNLFKRTIGVFDNNDNYCLTIKYGDCETDGPGCTDDSDIASGIVNIKIADVQNSSLDLAATILHEGIHAELYKYVYEHNNGIDPNDRPNLLQHYFHHKTFENNSFSTSKAQHQHMADNYVKPIAKAIRALDNNRYPLDYYLGFAWDGLRQYGWDGYWDNDVWKTLERNDPYQGYQDTVLNTTNFPNN